MQDFKSATSYVSYDLIPKVMSIILPFLDKVSKNSDRHGTAIEANEHLFGRFGAATAAYRDLTGHSTNQVLILNGESGSGKTGRLLI
jgi:hypothetical protein